MRQFDPVIVLLFSILVVLLLVFVFWHGDGAR